MERFNARKLFLTRLDESGLLGPVVLVIMLLAVIAAGYGLPELFAQAFVGKIAMTTTGAWSAAFVGFLSGMFVHFHVSQIKGITSNALRDISAVPWFPVIFVFAFTLLLTSEAWSLAEFLSSDVPRALLAAGTTAVVVSIPWWSVQRLEIAERQRNVRHFLRYRVEGRIENGEWKTVEQLPDDQFDYLKAISRAKQTGVWHELRVIRETGQATRLREGEFGFFSG